MKEVYNSLEDGTVRKEQDAMNCHISFIPRSVNFHNIE